MKHLIQDLSSGETRLIDAPYPSNAPNSLVISSRCSLVSVGTERMLVSFGKASLINKARQQPEKVRQVLEKVATDGLFATVDAVRSKLGQPIPLGYSNVGVVREVGKNIAGFRVGDRVVSNGGHAEIVRVPSNLCAKVPDAVSDQTAAFTVVASIGLQGVRLAQPTIGESMVVMGTGLIGLLTVQILLANGCRVLAIDYDPEKLALARKWGAETCNLADGEDPVEKGLAFSDGIGVDAVLVTASTSSSEPLKQAAKMSRKRGRIVLVGVAGLEFDRADLYEKELTFQVSCSYGPGRYDPFYEEGGHDYPVGFVRWTEKRNFEAVLKLMESGRIDVSDMISREVSFENAPRVYDELATDKSLLGVLLTYGATDEARAARAIPLSNDDRLSPAVEAPIFGVVGAGNYATRILIPAFKEAGARFGPIITSAGLSGSIAGEKFGFNESTTDIEGAIRDPQVTALIIATRHDSHARLAAKALAAGKDVFVEKPLSVDREGLSIIHEALKASSHTGSAPRLMVGFNRRFAPHVIRMRSLLATVAAPKSFLMTMNAGAVPPEHWTQDLEKGGGRIIGEACHLIDLMRCLAGCPIVRVTATRMADNVFEPVTEDKAFIILDFEDGSHGVIHYLANGAAAFPKERIEAFTGGRVLQLDNYRELRGFGWPGFRRARSFRQDKGQVACAAAFHDALLRGAPSPIPLDEIFEVSERTIEAAEQMRAH